MSTITRAMKDSHWVWSGSVRCFGNRGFISNAWMYLLKYHWTHQEHNLWSKVAQSRHGAWYFTDSLTKSKERTCAKWKRKVNQWLCSKKINILRFEVIWIEIGPLDSILKKKKKIKYIMKIEAKEVGLGGWWELCLQKGGIQGGSCRGARSTSKWRQANLEARQEEVIPGRKPLRCSCLVCPQRI